jgi:hypothetical protein
MTQRRDYIYRGHAILVEADERQPGRWGWSFLVDGRIASTSLERAAADPWSAITQGLGAARFRVDEIEHG